MQTRIYALAAFVVLLLALAVLPSGADASKPTYGKPPFPGKYAFHPLGGGPWAGSLMLKKHGPHGYTVVDMEIKLPEEEGCEEIAGMMAQVTRTLHPKRFVRHSLLENDVSWDFPTKKHTRGSGFWNTPNVQLAIGSQSFPAHLDLGFSRGFPDEPVGGSVSGDVSLKRVDHPECFLSWEGHRAG